MASKYDVSLTAQPFFPRINYLSIQKSESYDGKAATKRYHRDANQWIIWTCNQHLHLISCPMFILYRFSSNLRCISILVHEKKTVFGYNLINSRCHHHRFVMMLHSVCCYEVSFGVFFFNVKSFCVAISSLWCCDSNSISKVCPTVRLCVRHTITSFHSNAFLSTNFFKHFSWAQLIVKQSKFYRIGKELKV